MTDDSGAPSVDRYVCSSFLFIDENRPDLSGIPDFLFGRFFCSPSH